MKTMRSFGFLLVLAVLGLLLLPTPGVTQQSGLQSYDVELIIFRRLTDNATPEQWSLEASAASARLAIPDEEGDEAVVGGDPPESAAFPALPASKMKLTALEESLRRSRDYRPIAHIGWTQPGYARNQVRILPIGTIAPSASDLRGQLALWRGRYLHLTVDLVYEIPEEGGQRYVLRQTRRMRSNERHYLDHPKFGVIALITPSKPE